MGYRAIGSVLVFLVLLAPTNAHFNLWRPFPYNRVSCKASESYCKGACPPIWKAGNAKARNSPENPAAVWRRGQTVTIDWHKNNHLGGFLRRSLVPVKYMFDHDWHKNAAFEFGCNQQQIVPCNGGDDECGSDLNNQAYRNRMTIPDVFPDGDYVFGQVWYGGYDPGQLYSKYSDYFACAFVKISGGNKLKARYTATWTGPNRQCVSGKREPLTCGGDGCGRGVRVRTTVPLEFPGGRSAQVVQASLFGARVMEPVSVPMEQVPGMEMSMPSLMQNAPRNQNSPVMQAAKIEEEVSPGDTRAGTVPMSRNGPIDKVVVYVGFKVEAELEDGDSVEIDLGGRPASVEAITRRSSRSSLPVFFKTEGVATWVETRMPYVWTGNVGRDVRNYNPLGSLLTLEEKNFLKENDGKPFNLEIVTYRDQKRYSMTVTLTLKI